MYMKWMLETAMARTSHHTRSWSSLMTKSRKIKQQSALSTAVLKLIFYRSCRNDIGERDEKVLQLLPVTRERLLFEYEPIL
uniref:Uncharacterized protein n=1 Tax=Heterorhabditis bacteriophora TaxID=37862 RepID=A0A1I7WEM4_HETBA